MRVRPDIEVLGLPAEQQIADAPAHQIRRVMGLVEAIEDAEGVRVDLAARNRVFRAREDDGIGHERPL
jgi:hypothetical protein